MQLNPISLQNLSVPNHNQLSNLSDMLKVFKLPYSEPFSPYDKVSFEYDSKNIHKNPSLMFADDGIYNTNKKIKSNSYHFGGMPSTSNSMDPCVFPSYNIQNHPFKTGMNNQILSQSHTSKAIFEQKLWDYQTLLELSSKIQAINNNLLFLDCLNLQNLTTENKKLLDSPPEGLEGPQRKPTNNKPLLKNYSNLKIKDHKRNQTTKICNTEPILIIDDDEVYSKNSEDICMLVKFDKPYSEMPVNLESTLQKDDEDQKNNFLSGESVSFKQQNESANLILLEENKVTHNDNNIEKNRDEEDKKGTFNINSVAVIPPFKLNVKKAQKTIIRPIWTPSLIERRDFDKYMSKMGEVLGQKVTNEEKVVKLLVKFELNIEGLLNHMKKNKALYRNYFSMTQKNLRQRH